MIIFSWSMKFHLCSNVWSLFCFRYLKSSQLTVEFIIIGKQSNSSGWLFIVRTWLKTMLCWLVVIFDLHSVICYKFERSFKGATTLSTCVLLTSGAPWSKTGLSCVSSLRFRILGCDVPLMSVRSCLGSCWWRKCLPPYMFGVWYVDAFVYLCWWLFSRADFCDFILLLYLCLCIINASIYEPIFCAASHAGDMFTLFLGFEILSQPW
jgi:hypothetical protein